MPGVPKVIGRHNHTIFQASALQICTKLDTKEELVSWTGCRERDRIRTARRQDRNIHALIEQDREAAMAGTLHSDRETRCSHDFILSESKPGKEGRRTSSLSLEISKDIIEFPEI
jgi:hypothetical protein